MQKCKSEMRGQGGGSRGEWGRKLYESIEYGVWVIAALQVAGGGSGWQVAGGKLEVAICDFKGRDRGDRLGQPYGRAGYFARLRMIHSA